MKRLLLFVALLCLALNSALARQRRSAHKDLHDPQFHWAVLIAGSKGWMNYRHQADVYHAYQVLKAHGVPEEQIITFAFDDIAHYDRNPYYGKVYNNPGLEDVYKGITIDYKGYDVNRDNFLNVLAGDEKAMRYKGSGKVLKAGPDDRVFVFYSDHGSIGVVSLPDSRFLYADQLMSVIEQRQKDGGFKEMVLYIEACEAGSMFEGFNERLKDVYVATAANGIESSWATYCPSWSGDPREPVQRLGTCMGDLFSVAWMEDSTEHSIEDQSLQEQFDSVKYRTSNSGTYFMGSHVMQYGVAQIMKQPVSNYQGATNVDDDMLDKYWSEHGQQASSNGGSNDSSPANYIQVATRDADLHYLISKVHMAEEDSEEQKEAREQVDTLLRARRLHDDRIYSAVSSLITTPSTFITILPSIASHVAHNPQQQPLTRTAHTFASLANELVASVAQNNVSFDSVKSFTNHVGDEHTADLVDMVINERIMPNAAKPMNEQEAVSDWDCLRGMVDTWESMCGQLGEYGMKSTRVFANLCNSGVEAGAIGDVAANACSGESMPVVAE